MSRTFVNGKVWIRRTACPTCIFRPGNLMHLEEGRVEQMVRDSVANESCIPCHHHLHGNQPVEPVCRGFYDRHATTPIQIAERLGMIEWVDG